MLAKLLSGHVHMSVAKLKLAGSVRMQAVMIVDNKYQLVGLVGQAVDLGVCCVSHLLCCGCG